MFEPCPCGSGATLLACCGPVLLGQRPAATAEALMRSRYTAFARGDVGHLLRSWAPETRPATLALDPAQVWTGLTVLETASLGADEALVAFRASYAHPSGDGALEERSRFRRARGVWLYVDGAH